MESFTPNELAEALRAIDSTIRKCEKVLPKLKEGTSQHTLLIRRIKALRISSSLIEKEMNTEKQIKTLFTDWNKNQSFSGVFSVRSKDRVIFEQAAGQRNKAEQLPNRPDTAFGIASGTKFFTELAVCILIDQGKLALDDCIGEILPFDLKRINPEITVRHLLTHTSGIGDYIDEETSDDYSDMNALYDKYPVYHWNSLAYYLPMFHELPAKFSPGERFGYSNAGFILLGLIIERISGMDYHQYVTEHIIKPCQLTHTGFYRMDRLPGNTALGYCYDENKKEWYSNMFSLPVIGGSDGGIFTCAEDLNRLWRCVMECRLFSNEMKQAFFTPQVKSSEKNPQLHCGLGVFVYEDQGRQVYYAVGGDFGIDFFTAYVPDLDLVVSALGNTEMNTGGLLKKVFEELRGV